MRAHLVVAGESSFVAGRTVSPSDASVLFLAARLPDGVA